MPRRSRYFYALGAVFLVIAAGHVVSNLTTSKPLHEGVLDLLLIGLPGLLFVYVGSWLSRTELDPALYSRIALWCLGGVGVMFFFIVLRTAHPGVDVRWTLGTRAIALSFGSIAGLAIGIHEARARTRERELDRRNEELRTVRRSLEDRNEELVQTRERLERTVRQVENSNDRLEQFAYTASHDLQEPLRMITNYLELLDERYSEALDEDASEFIDFALDGASRMQTMVEDLLQYSRVETRNDQFGSVDLEAVLADVRRDLQLRIDESSAAITTEELPRVEGDAAQLRRLFQNLVSNAIEYSGDEPPRIHVSARHDGSEEVISVSDAGIGIEPADQERMFEIFQRLHAVDEHAGSGIGLALCRRIVERHGGEIWIDSEAGEGATFSFTVPSAGEVPDSSAASSQGASVD